MSSPYSFQPKTRRETREAEKTPAQKKRSPKKSNGKILGIFKTEKSFTVTAVGLSVAIVGVSVFSAWQSGLFTREAPFVLAGPETFNEQSAQSLDELLVYNPETGELEVRKNADGILGSDETINGENPNGAIQIPETLPNYTEEDFITDIDYQADSEISNLVSTAASYRVTNAGSPRNTLEKVARVLGVPGTVKTLQNSYNPMIWLSGPDDFQGPYVRFYYYTNDIPKLYSTSSVAYWEYETGTQECSGNATSPNLSLQQYNSLSERQKNCYDNRVMSGQANGIPVNQTQVRTDIERILTNLSYNPSNFQFDFFPSSDGAISALATFLIENQVAPLTFEFIYINGGRLMYATGPDFRISASGSFPLMSPTDAAKRLNNYVFYGDIPLIELFKYTGFNFAQPPAPVESALSNISVTQIDIQYAPDINPNENNGTIPGFENVVAAVSPRIVEQVQESSNIWRIDLGRTLTERQANEVAGDLRESPSVLFASSNKYIENERPTTSTPSTFNVTANDKVWIMIIDARGNNHIVKGYTYVNNSTKTYYGAVNALDDSVLGIR